MSVTFPSFEPIWTVQVSIIMRFFEQIRDVHARNVLWEKAHRQHPMLPKGRTFNGEPAHAASAGRDTNPGQEHG